MDVKGAKLICIEATTRYPVVSAYEYEFLKGEEAVQQRMQGCTIYVIMQRPLTYFDNVRLVPGGITFEITDDTQPPLRCTLDLQANGICEPSDTNWIEVGYYKREPDTEPPFRDVAAIKVLKGGEEANGTKEFVVWYSPQKFLYEWAVGNLQATVDGDPWTFTDYDVHYIGKAFSQPVWKRLTGHDKMQRILTLEGTLSTKPTRAPFEISLLMLDIVGCTEGVLCPYQEGLLPPSPPPFVHTVNMEDGGWEKFYEPWLTPSSPEVTNEVEAKLVSLFKPAYNEVLFDTYPFIGSGTRAKGFTSSTLQLENMPLTLRTKRHTQGPTYVGLFEEP